MRADGTPWGPVTIERHRALQHQGIHLHVFYQGNDITLDCRFADDTTGIERAEVYLRNEFGFVYQVTPGVLATKVIEGAIEIREGAPFHG